MTGQGLRVEALGPRGADLGFKVANGKLPGGHAIK